MAATMMLVGTDDGDVGEFVGVAVGDGGSTAVVIGPVASCCVIGSDDDGGRCR